MELETSKRKGMKNKNIKMCSININGLNPYSPSDLNIVHH